MVTQATTGPRQPQQAPWNPRKQDEDGDNVAVVAEDVQLAVPLHYTTGHHLLDENPLSNMTYLSIKKRNKHKSTETISKHSRYILEESTQNTRRNSSAP